MGWRYGAGGMLAALVLGAIGWPGTAAAQFSLPPTFNPQARQLAPSTGAPVRPSPGHGAAVRGPAERRIPFAAADAGAGKHGGPGLPLASRPVRTRRPADHQWPGLAGVPGAARLGRRVPHCQGRPRREPGRRAAARRLRGACRLRHGEHGQGGPPARGGAGNLRASGRRHQARRPGRRRADPRRPDHVRHLQGQPVRAGRQDGAGAGGHDRRRRHRARGAPITSSPTMATPMRWCAPTSACRRASSPTSR